MVKCCNWPWNRFWRRHIGLCLGRKMGWRRPCVQRKLYIEIAVLWYIIYFCISIMYIYIYAYPCLMCLHLVAPSKISSCLCSQQRPCPRSSKSSPWNELTSTRGLWCHWELDGFWSHGSQVETGWNWPRKITMEPDKTPLEEENHLN